MQVIFRVIASVAKQSQMRIT